MEEREAETRRFSAALLNLEDGLWEMGLGKVAKRSLQKQEKQ